jgi:hypothetical protein
MIKLILMLKTKKINIKIKNQNNSINLLLREMQELLSFSMLLCDENRHLSIS